MESIPGGKAVSYLTNTLVKLETGAKLEPDKEFGIKGFYLNGILVKSRSNEAGITFKMVYSQTEGIDNLLTNYVFLKDQKRIKGGGRSYYLDVCPDVKFAQRNFKDKYHSEPSLQEAFDKAVEEEMTSLIGNFDTIDDLIKDENETTLEHVDGDIYKDSETDKYYELVDGEYIEVEVEIEEE